MLSVKNVLTRCTAASQRRAAFLFRRRCCRGLGIHAQPSVLLSQLSALKTANFRPETHHRRLGVVAFVSKIANGGEKKDKGDGKGGNGGLAMRQAVSHVVGVVGVERAGHFIGYGGGAKLCIVDAVIGRKGREACNADDDG